jgi:hypothetical protein
MKGCLTETDVVDRISRLRFAARKALRLAIVFSCVFLGHGILLTTFRGGNDAIVRSLIVCLVVIGVCTSVMWCEYMQLVKSIELTKFLTHVFGTEDK